MANESSHIGIMHPVYYESLQEMGSGWERPHPGPFYWNAIQNSEGADYDWSAVDSYIQKSQGAGQNIVATIWPYADWDQSGTYTALTDDQISSFPEIGNYRHAPVNTEAYTTFVKALVERYDGDGVDDMAGLTQPITHWEVANEPSLTETIFFQGEASEYFTLLQTTYNAIKEADSDAKVINGGMAGAGTSVQAYWQQVLDLGGSQYIDIFSFHSISQGMDLDFPTIKTFLSQNGLTQEVWITEVEFEAMGLGGDSFTTNEYANILTKVMSTAFANGAAKFFYVGTAMGPGDETSRFELLTDFSGQQGQSLPAYDSSILQPTSDSIKTFANELDFFTSASVISETRSGNTVTDAVYQFTDGTRTAYVAWGTGSSIPSGLPDTVRTITATGTSTTTSSSSISFTSDPTIISTFQNISGTASADSGTGWDNMDIFTAGSGADTISGAAGDDIIYGNKETDLLYGNDGADTLYGGQNDGTPTTTDADNVSAQRDGVDTLYGGAGNDVLYGDRGGDLLYGEAGSDTIHGGADDDTMYGGDSADVFVMDSGDDVIGDFDITQDRISTSLTRTSTTDGSDGAVITFSNGATLTLSGVAASAVTDGLFT